MPSEPLQIEVSREKKNPLLGRTELILQVRHSGSGTPDRQQLRAEIARVSKATPESVYIRKITTDYGAGISKCNASVYDSPQLGGSVEQEYIRKRNFPKEEKEKAAEPVATTPQPRAETPIPTAAPTKARPESTEPQQTSTVEKEPIEANEPPAEAPAKPKAQRKKPVKEKEVEGTPAELEPPASESQNGPK